MNPVTVSHNCLVLFSISLGVIMYRAATDPENSLRVLFRRYLSHLDSRLQAMQLPAQGVRIAAAQGLGLALIGGTLLWSGVGPWLAFAAVPLVMLPEIALGWMRRTRDARIEASVTTFCVSLANALKTTPSIGKALPRVQTVLSGPLADEVALTLRELRLGTTVDQALLNLSARVRCSTLDVAISAVLIGRQVGGSIPAILESTAASFREMERLQGVLRVKTSEGKGQVWVMALAPAFLVLGLDTMQPGYFEPLFDRGAGVVLLVVVVGCWVASIVAARRILTVDM